MLQHIERQVTTETNKINSFPAILNKDISFNHFGVQKIFKKGTQILIDLNNDIALIENIHVIVFKNERLLLLS